jgi:integrase
MNSLLRSDPDHPHLPAGLRVEEAVRIAEAITAAHAESTRTKYDWAWSQWERWCHARGAALILLGYASAMRRSELAALTLADVEFQPGGVILAVRRSKTDQYADGQVVAVVHGQQAATDPIAALDAWLRHRGTEPGRVFTSPRSGSVTTDPISGEAISIVLRKRARAAGLAAERITAHSLRAGHATSAAVAGVALDRIAAQTRHQRLSTFIERYIRPAQAMEYTSSRGLGL